MSVTIRASEKRAGSEDLEFECAFSGNVPDFVHGTYVTSWSMQIVHPW